MACNGLTFDEGEQGIGESIPKVNGISCNSSSRKVHEFGVSNSSTSLENDSPINLKKQTKRSWESPKIEVPYKLRNKKIKERILEKKRG
jgi:hypothetical protein